ncbi:hypothetical protein [Lyngbya confervoides]|uniref:DUF11 domain-containing protein n=1 Tax=Lyngbya confervoides BDU141951 TaxID=1574623 RepID=A0ABD4T4U6_9CYAN|nr:hypothetical protein [Lyngbya confervoides]MCM1983679.1 hypothetical protein [Lyngbya confervoides BDU141951]
MIAPQILIHRYGLLYLPRLHFVLPLLMRSYQGIHPWIRRLRPLILLIYLLQSATTIRAEDLGADHGHTPLTPQATESSQIPISNRARFQYQYKARTRLGETNAVDLEILRPLVDPRGQILGCNGQILEDYTGFQVGLYDPAPNDSTGTELGGLTPLTATELPDIRGNEIPAGITPNTLNRNPYSLTNEEEGTYSFLLNRGTGQLDIGRTYILVVDPPTGSIYSQRRIRIEIIDILPLGDNDREQVQYEAVSLDGLPIGMQGEMEITQSVVLIEDADRIGLQLVAVQFMNSLCQSNQIEIVKSGDRANAAPGDTVLYRLQVRNISDGDLDTLLVTDVLPMGFKFLDSMVQAELDGRLIELTVNQRGNTLSFSSRETLPRDETLVIVYGAQLTPDALRGDGLNSATVTAQRVDNDLEVLDGPSIHRVRITPGLLSDCGTILGRVFVDRNFDGKQQPGEPGVPNAVVWMDDGNRITTDEDGLFNVQCVLPGYRTGALDPESLEGYTLAPNLKFIERNSPARLVHLAPGGMVRMNFGVMPTANGEDRE